MDTIDKQLRDLKIESNFAKAVVTLARDIGLIPKKQSYRTRTITKTKIVVRKPRTSKAIPKAPKVTVGPSADVGQTEPKRRGRPKKQQLEIPTPME